VKDYNILSRKKNVQAWSMQFFDFFATKYRIIPQLSTSCIYDKHYTAAAPFSYDSLGLSHISPHPSKEKLPLLVDTSAFFRLIAFKPCYRQQKHATEQNR